MKRYILLSKFLLNLLLFIIFGICSLSAQDIQPLGFPKGHYSIAPNGRSQAQVFCVNEDILTSTGQVYNAVKLGNAQAELLIGGRKYTIQQAINNRLISFKLIKTPELEDPLSMFMELRNLTSNSVSLEVKDDLVFANRTSKAPLKSTKYLNPEVNDLQIDKQSLIWFSHNFEKYLSENKETLTASGFLGPDENPTLQEFLKKRKEFLLANGIPPINYDLTRDGFMFGKEITLTPLMTEKALLKKRNSEGFEKQYLIRYNDGNYFLDDGSSIPIYSGNDPYELVKKLDAADKVYVDMRGFLSKVREDNFLTTLRIAKRVPIFRDNLLDKNPLLKSVSEIYKDGENSAFDIEVETKFISKYDKPDHTLTFREKSRDLITKLFNKIYGYFGGTGKNATQSLASILEESKQEIRQAFPESVLEIIIDHSVIYTLNEKNWKQFLENYYCYDSDTIKAK